MIEFLTENWKLLVILGAIIIDLVVILVTKKRPQVIDRSFLYVLCGYIEDAESRFDKGEDKLSYVLALAKQYLGDNFNEKEVIKVVEWLLSLPEKKKEKKL